MSEQKVPEGPKKSQQKQSVIRSAISMAVGTFLSRILGLVRDTVMIHLFPTAVTDTWVVAFRLPNFFRRLLGEGSLSVSFIPVYVDARAQSKERAAHLSNAVFTIVLAVSTFISVACFVFMEPIIRFLVDDPQGFGSVPGKVEQTIYLARIMIFYLVLVSTYAYHMAIANTLGYFFVPGMGPTLFNFALIIFTAFQFELGPYPGSSQSWGVIAGGVLQALAVLLLLMRLGVLPRLTWQWRGPDVRKVFVNMVPGLFGLGVYQVMLIVNTKFAARLPLGAQTYIYLADRVLELPQALIAVSLGAALLPRFSDLHSSGEKGKFLAEANASVRALLYLSMPAAVGMWVLSLPITEVLFMRGNFKLEDAMATASVVQVYAVLLLFSSWARITAPAFYALKNTTLPAAVAFFVLMIHISLGPWLVDNFGLVGLASATSVSSILNILILQVFFYRLIGPIGYAAILMCILRLIPALTALGFFCWYAYEPLRQSMGRTSALIVVISIGMFIYFALTVMFRSPEAEKVFGMFRRRLLRR